MNMGCGFPPERGRSLRGSGRANGAKFLRNFLLPFARRRALGQNASRSVLSLSSKAKVKCGFAAFARARPDRVNRYRSCPLKIRLSLLFKLNKKAMSQTTVDYLMINYTEKSRRGRPVCRPGNTETKYMLLRADTRVRPYAFDFSIINHILVQSQ